MGRFIVTYHAPVSVQQRFATATREEAMAGMQQWIDWAQKLGPHLVDPGRPLGRAVSLSSAGESDAQSSMVGMSIIDAPTFEDALQLVRGHHHLHWAPDCTLTLHEEIPLPEQS